MSILLISEYNDQGLSSTIFSLCAAAQELRAPMDLLLVGEGTAELPPAAHNLPGIRKVLWGNGQQKGASLPEVVAPRVAELMTDYTYLIGAATTFGKSLLPRIAALLDCPMVSEIIKVIDKKTFVRPAYAGNVLQTLEVKTSKVVLSVRVTAFESKSDVGATPALIEKVNWKTPDTMLSRFVKRQELEHERPDLASARIVVSGGRGLQKKENVRLIEELADCLGGAVGATRAVVDAGFFPNDLQVGQTGKVVAPDIYFAIGISGAIQHLAGMKDSKIIVAINKDPEAPIMQVATYALVGDLFEIVPTLIQQLKSR